MIPGNVHGQHQASRCQGSRGAVVWRPQARDVCIQPLLFRWPAHKCAPVHWGMLQCTWGIQPMGMLQCTMGMLQCIGTIGEAAKWQMKAHEGTCWSVVSEAENPSMATLEVGSTATTTWDPSPRATVRLP